MSQLIIKHDVGEVSDGHHTFNELYDHRCLLFIALMGAHPDISWRARNHDDGTMFPGWFVAGMHLPTGDITYHLKDHDWAYLDGIKVMDIAPVWDKHDSGDVLDRIGEWLDWQRDNPQ